MPETIKKNYLMSQTVTCAINCPFLAISNKFSHSSTEASDSSEDMHIRCERYNELLFQTQDGDKLIRLKKCNIKSVTWTFLFEDETQDGKAKHKTKP